MISPEDHAFMHGKMKMADTWGRLQPSWNPEWQESAAQATLTLLMDDYWGKCHREDESKP